MSQFNSIFSPLSNKLARLAGITLLAVAALFASTQQMSAQISCVQNVTVSLSSVCNDQVTVEMVSLGGATSATHYVRINDDTPTDDRVNSVSPASGWTYGLFKKSDNTLVCQGTIIVRDDQAPTFSVAQKAAWEAIDTIITWADNVDEILNVPQTWFGNTSKYADAPSFGAVKYYTGRPYMTDSCELWRGGVSKADSTWIIDQDGDGLSNRNLNNANNEANGWYFLHRSTNLQIKVTDYYENGQCNNTNVNSPTSGAQGSTNSFHHYLRRSFQFIDQRGNDTTLNQIIYFQRPAPRGTGSDRFANLTTPGSNPQSPLDRGPGNLAQFGPFGDGPRKIHSSYGENDNLDLVNSSKKIATFTYKDELGKDQMTGNYSTFSDVIAYNIDQSSTNGGGTCYDFQDSELEKLLSGLYVAVDTLPSGDKDSISLFSKILNSQYSVSFNYKKFPACNNGKKYEVVTTVFDWCSGLQSFDTLVIKMEDNTPPVFTRYNSQANTGTTASSGIKGQTPGDSVIISVGLNDCTANLRLPNKTGSRSDLRDLSALFNLGVYDRCATGSNNTTDRNGNSVTLNYRIQSKDTWNNGFYLPRNEWADVNYTVANLGAGGTPVVMGLPIGEHRIIIEAWDQCSNRSFTTLYFDVQDMVAPTMKCDDQLNVTLTSNSTTNWYINGNGSDVSERELSDDQNARVYVADINEGSKDNCTLDSMYVRRKVSKACIEKYLVWNMDYDVFGDNNGSVTADGDFEKVSGTTDMYYTPKYMQYIEVMCCDGASGSQVMFELWGSDLVQSIPGNSNVNPPASRNWSFCWGNIQIEDKTDPVITAPDLNKPYNTAYDYRDQTKRPVRNWVSCIDKEIIGDPTVVDKNNPKSGDIANEAISNKLFGYPDIYGLECKGKVDYRVVKRLSCDTGVILRIWEVEKEIKPGIKTIKLDTQIIWVQANHNYTIRVPRDIDLECGANISDTKVTYDADGCDLLAISGYNQKVYDAGDGEIACKKVYRTWTVINWCQLPNQFRCNNADPGLYARIIPRLRDLNQPADAQRPAIEIEHRFQKSVSSTVRIKGDQLKNGQNAYNYWGLAATASPTWPSAAQTGSTSISHRKVFTTATDYTTMNGIAYDAPNANPGCASLNEQTFAWQYTQVIKVSDSKIPDLVRNTAEDLDFTAIDDDGASATSAINWNKNLKVFGIRGKVANSSSTTAQGLTGQECLAKVKFSFNMKDDCGFSGPFSLDKATVVLKNATTPNTTAIGNEQSKSFVWNGGTTTPDNSTNIIVDPIDRGSPNNNGTTTATFNVTIDNLPVKDATDGDGIRGRTTYELLVEVRDDCGNVRVERIDFTVGDIKAPAPVCVSNFQVSLMPTNDGEKDNKGMVRLFARDVFQDINRLWENDECTGPVKVRIVRTIEDTATTLAGKEAYGEFIDLNCSDLAAGGRNVRVYLIDAAGNYNYCEINVDIADNAGICADGQSSAAVAGAIQTETKATVEGVQVNLSGQSQKSFATGVNGLFVFNNLTAGADYTVTPSLNKGFLNGVSTFDLVLISKHILGVQPLNTPYKLIAADVNNSKSVTTLDLIQLRKLILNIDATFANNSSWRFVDASYTFPSASNPWAASFPEVKNVNDLVGSLSANFVAVKVGDVNGNAIANSTQGSVRNLTSNLGISVADMNLVAGNEYKVDFTAADLNGIEGFQFTLNLDKKGLELVDLVPGIAAEENFGIFAEEGVVTASWNGEAKGGVLFSLVVRAKSNTTLSEVLNLNSRYTAAEAYKGGEVVNVGLNFNASKASANYELYQNTPNPFAGESIIGFNLPVAGAATLTIQDVTGRTLKVINGQYAKGYNQVSLKSTELSATGVLTYTLKAADFTATRKMIIVE